MNLKKKILVFIFFVFVIFSACSSQCSHTELLKFQNKPEKRLRKGIEISCYLNPCHIQGDLNGDGLKDVASLIMETDHKKRGISISHTNGKLFIIGAGKVFGNGGDDFNWLDYWYLYEKEKTIEHGFDRKPSPKLLGDALYVGKLESASAIIYWDGTSYRWYQQGD